MRLRSFLPLLFIAVTNLFSFLSDFEANRVFSSSSQQFSLWLQRYCGFCSFTGVNGVHLQITILCVVLWVKYDESVIQGYFQILYHKSFVYKSSIISDLEQLKFESSPLKCFHENVYRIATMEFA